MNHFGKLEILGLALLALYTFVYFALPSSYWFTVNRFDVQDALEGDRIIIDYDRTIRREYVADWRVVVREVVSDGLRQVCSTGTHRQNYDPQSRLPDPVALEWLAFTDPDCFMLPSGDYTVTVTWDLNPVLPGALLLSRTVQATDRFSVAKP